MRVAVEIKSGEEERGKLERWRSSRSVSMRLRERSEIVSRASEGKTNQEIAAELGIDRSKVGRWRKRYAAGGLKGIEKERARGGNHGGKDSGEQARLRQQVLEATTQSKPKDATHGSCRSLARQLGTTHSFVNRVWQSYGLKPHLMRSFKLSNDRRFEEKLRDGVGLYLDPPRNAVVFSLDEKSSIQALDRTQPGLPLKKGRCGTRTHDSRRHGTTTLFAALKVASGEVLGKSYRRHRHGELLRFLREGEKTVPKAQEIHIILDHYATPKHAKVLKWIERKKRIFLHFIPTSSSWLNLVERFFGRLTEKQLRRGVFPSVQDLERCLKNYRKTCNENPRPRVWTKSAAPILEQGERARLAFPHTPQAMLCSGHTTRLMAVFVRDFAGWG